MEKVRSLVRKLELGDDGYFVVRSIPVLDEHKNGDVIVDRNRLEKIMQVMNGRPPAAIIIGHTKDGSEEEMPVVGYADNWKIEDGHLCCDFHVYDKEVIKKYPRRSVELWVEYNIIDPIALLGSSAPQRPLPHLIIRDDTLDDELLIDTSDNKATVVLPTSYKYSRKEGKCICYSIENIIKYRRSKDMADKKNKKDKEKEKENEDFIKFEDTGDELEDTSEKEEKEKEPKEKKTTGDSQVDKIVEAVLSALYETPEWQLLSQITDEYFALQEEMQNQGAQMGGGAEGEAAEGQGGPPPTSPEQAPPGGVMKQDLSSGQTFVPKARFDLSHLENEVKKLSLENKLIKRKYELSKLVAEGYPIDVDEEAEMTLDLPDEKFNKYLYSLRLRGKKPAEYWIPVRDSIEDKPIDKETMQKIVRYSMENNVTYDEAKAKILGKLK